MTGQRAAAGSRALPDGGQRGPERRSVNDGVSNKPQESKTILPCVTLEQQAEEEAAFLRISHRRRDGGHGQRLASIPRLERPAN